MSTFLLKWKPSVYPWLELPECVDQVRHEGSCLLRWSCGNTKKIKAGDRVFLLRRPNPPAGIMGAGTVTKGSYEDEHYARPSETAVYVEARFDSLINVTTESAVLSVSRLSQPDLSGGPWTIRGSGKTIPSPVAEKLEHVWQQLLDVRAKYSAPLPEEIAVPQKFTEGAMRQITVNAYERDPEARQLCIEHHGWRCAVCKFDFEERYGELGRGFIHVHHLKPLSETQRPHEISPIDDLRPVCPNCHAMLHRPPEVMAIETLETLLRR